MPHLAMFGKLQTVAGRLANGSPRLRAAEPAANLAPPQETKPMIIMPASIRACSFLRAAPLARAVNWLGLWLVMSGLLAPGRAGAAGSLAAR